MFGLLGHRGSLPYLSVLDPGLPNCPAHFPPETCPGLGRAQFESLLFEPLPKPKGLLYFLIQSFPPPAQVNLAAVLGWKPAFHKSMVPVVLLPLWGGWGRQCGGTEGPGAQLTRRGVSRGISHPSSPVLHPEAIPDTLPPTLQIPPPAPHLFLIRPCC